MAAHEGLTNIISGDTHLEIDSKAWVDRVPTQHRERAPRVVRLPDGADAWLVEGAPLQDMIFSLHAGKGWDHWAPFQQTYEGSAGTGGPDQRVAEQDKDGIAAEILFTGVNGPKFWRNIRDDEAYLSFVRAYNGFLAEDYCSYAPDRLIGVGVIPWTNVDDAIAEMKFCHDKGLRAIMLGVFPNGSSRPLPEDDRFWQEALHLGIAVTAHVELEKSRGAGLTKQIDMHDTSERARRALAPETIITQQTSVFGRAGLVNAMQMAMTGVFDRFPNLKMFFAETQVGWLPFAMEMGDLRYHRHAKWVEREMGWKRVKRLPSEYLREHCYWGFQQDRVGVTLREIIGTDRMIWATDFPHQESEWPESMKVIDFNFEGVPQDEVKLMTNGNVSRFFGLTPTT